MILARGYAATSIDALCRQAGVAKGAFFHHFDSKDALALAAFRRPLLVGAPETFTCLVGTMMQEIFARQPRLSGMGFA